MVERNNTERNLESGFTLVEMVVAVSVLGVLGTLVIPSFVRDARKAKYDSEVNAVFGELLEREDQHKVEFGAYHAAAQCPAVTNDNGTDVSACTATGGDWDTLKMSPKLRSLRCTYTVSTGCPSDIASPPAGMVFNQGVASWTFVVANCGTGRDTYTYFASSTNPKVQKLRGTIGFTESQSCTTTIASNTASVPTGGGSSGASSGASGSSSTGTGTSTGTGSTGTVASAGTGGSSTGTGGSTGTSGSTGTGTRTTTTSSTSTTTVDDSGNGNSIVKNGNNSHTNCGGAGNCEQSQGHTK